MTHAQFKCSHCTCLNVYNVLRTCGYNYNHWFVCVLLASLASSTKTECRMKNKLLRVIYSKLLYNNIILSLCVNYAVLLKDNMHHRSAHYYYKVVKPTIT